MSRSGGKGSRRRAGGLFCGGRGFRLATGLFFSVGLALKPGFAFAAMLEPEAGRRSFFPSSMVIPVSARQPEGISGRVLAGVPSARMPPVGTVGGMIETRIGALSLAQSVQVAIQPLPAVWLAARETLSRDLVGQVRQTGLDLRIRLHQETESWPQVVLGFDDVLADPVATRPSGSTYLMLGRQMGPVDLNVGIARGALAAGRRLRFLAGLTMRTPWPGLSLHLEYRRLPRLLQDTTVTGIEGAPVTVRLRGPRLWPVHAGVLWRGPWGLESGLALEGGRQVMIRAGLSRLPEDWPPYDASPPPRLRPRRLLVGRTPEQGVAALRRHLAGTGHRLALARLHATRAEVWVHLASPDGSARTLGRIAREMANTLPAEIEAFTIIGLWQGVRGSALTLHRQDLEQVRRHAGSVDEVMLHARVAPAPALPAELEMAERWSWALLPRLTFSPFAPGKPSLWWTRLVAETRLALGSGIGVVAGLQASDGRLGVAQHPVGIGFPGRLDQPLFAGTPLQMSRLALTAVTRLGEGIDAGVALGMLESMYGGISAEAVWQPEAARWNLGVRVARVVKRQPGSLFGRQPDPAVTTGDLALTYTLPSEIFGSDRLSADASSSREATPLTRIRLAVGRWLAKDWGSSLRLSRETAAGVELSAELIAASTVPYRRLGLVPTRSFEMTATLQLRFPFSIFDGVPPASRATVTVEPLVRMLGQTLDSPLALGELSATMSPGAVIRSWRTLLQ